MKKLLLILSSCVGSSFLAEAQTFELKASFLPGRFGAELNYRLDKRTTIGLHGDYINRDENFFQERVQKQQDHFAGLDHLRSEAERLVAEELASRPEAEEIAKKVAERVAKEVAEKLEEKGNKKAKEIANEVALRVAREAFGNFKVNHSIAKNKLEEKIAQESPVWNQEVLSLGFHINFFTEGFNSDSAIFIGFSPSYRNGKGLTVKEGSKRSTKVNAVTVPVTLGYQWVTAGGSLVISSDVQMGPSYDFLQEDFKTYYDFHILKIGLAV